MFGDPFAALADVQAQYYAVVSMWLTSESIDSDKHRPSRIDYPTTSYTMNERPQPLLEPVPQIIDTHQTLVSPITRRGYGPGLIVLVSAPSKGLWINDGIPSPIQKWGEEGYTVVEITAVSVSSLSTAIAALRNHEKCQPPDTVGLVSYDDGLWCAIQPQLAAHPEVVAAVLHTTSTTLDGITVPATTPLLIHAAGKCSRKPLRTQHRTEHVYEGQESQFASPSTPHFSYAAEAVSHTRSLTHLKKLMNGPYFDLEALWDEHTYYEFEVRDVEATMSTMVAEPYVNHIPTLTGGIGRKNLTAFYRDHFVFSNPDDTALELVSRTVGIDRVIDEFVFKLTHDRMIDWLFPGIPATGKYVEIPFMAVVNIRGDRLYHEHITWDHASALRQIGCLPHSVAYDRADVTAIQTNGSEGHHQPNGHKGASHQQQLILPVAGADTARKLRDKNAVESNVMFTAAGVRPTTQD